VAIEAEMMAEGLAIPNETHPDVVSDTHIHGWHAFSVITGSPF
jgi:hypothetical protein